MMKQRLYRVLLKRGLITEEVWEQCLEQERQTGESIDKILRDKGILTEDEFLEIYHRITRIPYLKSLNNARVPELFLKRVLPNFARNYNLVGIGQRNGVVQVATSEPLNFFPMDEVASRLQAQVDMVLAPRAEINTLIGRAYQQSADGVDEMLEGLDDDDILGAAEILDGAEDVLDVANKAPIIRLVNSILFEGIRRRASDIHFQPFEEKMLVRYRIDGLLHDLKTIPKRAQDAVTSRIKVMGRMDIAERRLPQDGRATVRVGDGEVDIRISSVPTSYGERIVLRLLDKTTKVYSLNDIGLTRRNYDLLNKFIHFSHGIILVTGPTGSGKTTSLYAVLEKLNSREKNVITIEDPIEYHLGGISQIQVSNKKGLTFSAGLRSILRQDPDVIMVGEIRDEETARIAIQSALTGHLVFSTLHTNDAAGAVTRLLDIGVEPYLVASSVICVVAQRLIRLVCHDCRSAYEPTSEELEEIGIDRADLKDNLLHMGMGCDQCLDTGYVGRTAIYEILPVVDRVREQVVRRAGATEIKKAAVLDGVRTLRMDGAIKVVEGMSSVEEVLRVTQMDIM